MNTETVIRRLFAIRCRGFRNAVTFFQGISQQTNHVCVFSPAHRRLECVRKLVSGDILDVWQQFW